MSPEAILSVFCQRRLAGSLRAATADSALRAAEAAVAGGISILEVPVSTPGFVRIISELRRTFGEKAVIGVGDVSTIEAADRAIKANVQFMTLPVAHTPLIEFAWKWGALAIPGAATPTEIAAAAAAGARMVRVFPIASLGGATYLAHVRRVLPDIHLMAAGGVSAAALPEYLLAGASVVTLGSGLFEPSSLAAGNYSALTEHVRSVVRLTETTT
jgi:2-dehydro-3-deoxyphosphogluconate aldolase/(4S)-4-hydroxy-2-oxoglutarate aldolase